MRLLLLGVVHKARLWLECAGHSAHPSAQGRVHQMRIALRCLHLAVPQQLADHLKRRASADQQRGKGVAQIMNPYIFDPNLFLDTRPEAADFLYRLAGHISGKEPWRPFHDCYTPLATIAAASSEIGTRCTRRCLVVVAGLVQLKCSRLKSSKRACRTSPTRAPVSMHRRIMPAARSSCAASSAVARREISSWDR